MRLKTEMRKKKWIESKEEKIKKIKRE